MHPELIKLGALLEADPKLKSRVVFAKVRCLSTLPGALWCRSMHLWRCIHQSIERGGTRHGYGLRLIALGCPDSYKFYGSSHAC